MNEIENPAQYGRVLLSCLGPALSSKCRERPTLKLDAQRRENRIILVGIS